MRPIKDIRELKIGDRICLERTDKSSHTIGNGKFDKLLGQVMAQAYDKYDNLLIEFDENIDGHGGSGLGEYGHCWWINWSYLESYKISKYPYQKRKHNFY